MAYHMNNPLDEHHGYENRIRTSIDNIPGYNTNQFPNEDNNGMNRMYEHTEYSLDDDPFGAGYKINKGDKDKKEEDFSEFEKQIQNEERIKEGNDEADEQMVQKKAANEIRLEAKNDRNEYENNKQKKKVVSSIEEAIENTIKSEKEVLYLE